MEETKSTTPGTEVVKKVKVPKEKKVKTPKEKKVKNTTVSVEPVAESILEIVAEDLSALLKPDPTEPDTINQEDIPAKIEAVKEVSEVMEIVEHQLDGPTVGPDEIIEKPKALSKQAVGWRDWLIYQRLTPEDFVARFPNHKMKHFVQEIIDFNKKS